MSARSVKRKTFVHVGRIVNFSWQVEKKRVVFVSFTHLYTPSVLRSRVATFELVRCPCCVRRSIEHVMLDMDCSATSINRVQHNRWCRRLSAAVLLKCLLCRLFLSLPTDLLGFSTIIFKVFPEPRMFESFFGGDALRWVVYENSSK